WEARRLLTVLTLALRRGLCFAATRWGSPDCSDATRSVSRVLKVASEDEVGSQRASSATSGRYVRHRVVAPSLSFGSCFMLFPASPCQSWYRLGHKDIENEAELSRRLTH